MKSVLQAESLHQQWYVVAESSDVGDEPHAVTLLGESYVIWRGASGSLVAAPDRCPHRQARLSEGAVADGCLTCPYHGWVFGSGGECLLVPSAQPGSAIPPGAHLETTALRDRYGLVWLSPGDPDGDVCEIPEDANPAFRRVNTGVEEWAVNVTRMVDNFLDVAHFPWVHAGTFGAEQDPLVPPVHVEELDHSFTGYRYEVDVQDADGKPVHQEMTTGFHLPFTVRSTSRFVTGPNAGADRVLLLCSTPVDHERSLFTFVVWRNDAGDTPDDELVAFDRRIGAEDRRMLERVAGELPLDLRSTVSVQADRASVEWRRRLRELAQRPAG